jgi:hypothetical protein
MPSKRREQQLLDRMWERVQPLLPHKPPHPKGGRPFADDKACFAGIVYQLRNIRNGVSVSDAEKAQAVEMCRSKPSQVQAKPSRRIAPSDRISGP